MKKKICPNCGWRETVYHDWDDECVICHTPMVEEKPAEK